MSEPARKLMSATEFCHWDDGTDTRYELIDGVPVAMAPPYMPHNQVAANAFRIIDGAVSKRRPCRGLMNTGIRLHEGPPGKVFIPDAMLTCEPIVRQHLSTAPRLVVEVLSRSTEGYDKELKLPAYATIPSIEEVWLVASQARLVMVWERRPEGWHSGLPLIGRASFTSPVLEVEVGLDALYELTELAADDAEAPSD